MLLLFLLGFFWCFFFLPTLKMESNKCLKMYLSDPLPKAVTDLKSVKAPVSLTPVRAACNL